MMKKGIYLALAAFTLSAVLSGCSGMTGTAGTADLSIPEDYSNVSTSPNGTVNGRNHGEGLTDDWQLDTGMELPLR